MSPLFTIHDLLGTKQSELSKSERPQKQPPSPGQPRDPAHLRQPDAGMNGPVFPSRARPREGPGVLAEAQSASLLPRGLPQQVWAHLGSGGTDELGQRLWGTRPKFPTEEGIKSRGKESEEVRICSLAFSATQPASLPGILRIHMAQKNQPNNQKTQQQQNPTIRSKTHHTTHSTYVLVALTHFESKYQMVLVMLMWQKKGGEDALLGFYFYFFQLKITGEKPAI